MRALRARAQQAAAGAAASQAELLSLKWRLEDALQVNQVHALLVPWHGVLTRKAGAAPQRGLSGSLVQAVGLGEADTRQGVRLSARNTFNINQG